MAILYRFTSEKGIVVASATIRCTVQPGVRLVSPAAVLAGSIWPDQLLQVPYQFKSTPVGVNILIYIDIFIAMIELDICRTNAMP